MEPTFTETLRQNRKARADFNPTRTWFGNDAPDWNWPLRAALRFETVALTDAPAAFTENNNGGKTE